MKDKTIGLLGIGIMITIVSVVGLFKGVNGQIFLSAIGSLAAIFGYYLGKKDIKKGV